MLRVRFSSLDFARLQAHLHQDQNEQHAFLLCGQITSAQGAVLVVRDLMLADPKTDLRDQAPAYVSLEPHYALQALERAGAEGLHLIDTHSHPFCSEGVGFSGIDRASAATRFQWHQERMPQMTSVGLVFGRNSVAGMFVAPGSTTPQAIEAVEIIGTNRRVLRATNAQARTQERELDPRFVRQVDAFGTVGQEELRNAKVGIVGLGGTGSALAQQLAYLGVRSFVLVDPDVVEWSNLNRLIGADRSDAQLAMPKTEVAARSIRRVEPLASIQALRSWVQGPEVEQALVGVDVVFGCGDNEGVRSVLNDLSVRALIPYFDLGTGIQASDGKISRAGGQVVFSSPGGPCLGCLGIVDPVRAATALRSPEERAHHEAHYGSESPAPSVVGLNCVIASLAVGEFLKYMTGWAVTSRRLQHDGITGAVETVQGHWRADCPVCSRSARYGLGTQDAAEFYAPLPEVGSI